MGTREEQGLPLEPEPMENMTTGHEGQGMPDSLSAIVVEQGSAGNTSSMGDERGASECHAASTITAESAGTMGTAVEAVDQSGTTVDDASFSVKSAVRMFEGMRTKDRAAVIAPKRSFRQGDVARKSMAAIRWRAAYTRVSSMHHIGDTKLSRLRHLVNMVEAEDGAAAETSGHGSNVMAMMISYCAADLTTAKALIDMLRLRGATVSAEMKHSDADDATPEIAPLCVGNINRCSALLVLLSPQ